jgi:protein Mpv17
MFYVKMQLPQFLIFFKVDWLVWPPTQFLNFYFIAPQYRVLYINAITMLYNVFLCYIKHQKLDDET